MRLFPELVTEIFRRVIPVLLIWIPFDQAICQEPVPNQGRLAIEQFRQGSALINGFDNRYEGVKGTPFFVDQWLPGRLEVVGSKEIISDVHMQLDVFNQDVYVRPDAMHSFFKMESEIHFFELIQNADDTLKFYQVDASAIHQTLHKKYYLMALWEGDNLSFFQLPFKILHKADYQGAYATGDRFDEFQPGDMWFVYNGREYQKVKLNQKSLIKLYPELKNNLKDMQIENVEDYVKALRWIDRQ
ncbi:MAG TPA: hypothetical protein P5275_10810 [Saprospiraceae bacterium]|nr:hypothetical protein [Saprospiraceae bacterium]HPG07001.1 hypothetical protein [Saprospiraceae bacterium]HPR00202.1 hypothetical protein [Saprospiraceae bacterium]HRV85346.1 hypothetical protein [Saprospiraceae bacterium]